MTPMLFDEVPRASRAAVLQAVVTFVADFLETTRQEPAVLEKEIDWNPEYFREQTLAEWLHCGDQTAGECARIFSAFTKSEGTAPGPVELPPDAGTPLYGSRPAEDYHPPNFVHEASAEPPDAFGQKQKLLFLSLGSVLDGAEERPEKDRMTLAKTIEGWGALVKRILKVS